MLVQDDDGKGGSAVVRRRIPACKAYTVAGGPRQISTECQEQEQEQEQEQRQRGRWQTTLGVVVWGEKAGGGWNRT